MSTEPEQEIEKRLRAYAKKRREQAGRPLELHPATRRLLQGEVARRFKKEGARSLWESLFWPRFAFAIAAVVLAAVAVSLWLPERNKGTITLAKNEEGNSARTVEEPRPLPAAAPAPASVEAGKRADLSRLRDEDRGQIESRKLGLEAGQAEAANQRLLTLNKTTADERFSDRTAAPLDSLKEGRAAGSVGALGGAVAQSRSEADGRRYGLAGNQPGSLLAPAAGTPPSTFGASIVADAAKPVAAEESLKARTEEAGKAQFASKSLRTAALAAPALASREKETASGTLALESPKNKDSSGSSVQRFRQVETRSVTAKLLYEPATPNSILASFQLERTGQSVRIVDADGSVYSGAVQAPAGLTPVLSAGDKKIPTDTEAKLEQKAAKGTAESQARQIYSFRAIGTNLSLNAKVVFTGNVIASASETSFKQTTNGPRGAVAESPTLPAEPSPLSVIPLLNSRVSGRALIGEGKEIEVNAVPVKP